MANPSPKTSFPAKEDATQLSDSDDEGSSPTPLWQGGRQDNTAQQKTSSPSCKLVRKLDSVVSNKPRTSQSKWKTVKPLLKDSYRKLLNGEIEDARGMSPMDVTGLSPSLIGASLWTPREKEALFRRLAFRGPHDFPSLCQATPTKSQAEIHTYIRLLQSGANDLSEVALADVPAACQISKECGDNLELAADALEILVDEHETNLERERFDGEYWLIDDEQATQLEDQFMLTEESLSPAHSDEGSPCNEPPAGERPPFHTLSAAALLRPASFLELSRELFMNHSNDDSLNWHSLTTCSTATDQPSMFRSAFEEFRDLTVNVTRRLVQASITQATSRLRAQDSSRQDWTPSASVRAIDVHTAANLLNMPSWQQYWSKVARRCQVQVYTESKRYVDGRPVTKSGIRGRLLTYDEVEAELRAERTILTKPPADEHEINDEDVDDAMDQEDLFTDGSDVGDQSSAEDEALLARNGRSRSRIRKRKQSLGASGFYHAEQSYLEALDRNAAVREERHLWTRVGREPENGFPSYVMMPPAPGPKPGEERLGASWRESINFESEWEHVSGRIPDQAFEAVGRRGALGQKRRRLLNKAIEERLRAECQESVETSLEEAQAQDDVESRDIVDIDNEEDASGNSVEIHADETESDSATSDRADRSYTLSGATAHPIKQTKTSPLYQAEATPST